MAVYSALTDTRGTPRLFASSCNPFFGMKVLRSTDLGRSFKETKFAPAFAKEDGRALLRRVAAIARERDCGRMEWEVLDWNEPSIGFYKKLGAVPMDEWTKYRLTGEALDRLL